MSNEIEARAENPINPFSPRNFEEVMRLAELMASSDLVPRDYQKKPGNCVIAMQMGSELGINPMQAVQNIAVINGRPSIWGDLGLAIVKSHRDFISMVETSTGEGEAEIAKCVIERKGQPTITVEYSVADAKTARLWGKEGPWKTAPSRMLQMRARWFAMRDQFPDALKGISAAEETIDYVVVDAQPTRSAEPPLEPPKERKKKAPEAEIVAQPTPTPTVAQSATVHADPTLITPIQLKAVKDCWAELRTKIPQSNEPIIWKALSAKFSIQRFDDIRQNQLTDVIMMIRSYLPQAEASDANEDAE